MESVVLQQSVNIHFPGGRVLAHYGVTRILNIRRVSVPLERKDALIRGAIKLIGSRCIDANFHIEPRLFDHVLECKPNE